MERPQQATDMHASNHVQLKVRGQERACELVSLKMGVEGIREGKEEEGKRNKGRGGKGKKERGRKRESERKPREDCAASFPRGP